MTLETPGHTTLFTQTRLQLMQKTGLLLQGKTRQVRPSQFPSKFSPLFKPIIMRAITVLSLQTVVKLLYTRAPKSCVWNPAVTELNTTSSKGSVSVLAVKEFQLLQVPLSGKPL